MKARFAMLIVLALVVSAFAHAQDDFEPTLYEPFGNAEVGEYTRMEGYEPGVNDADFLGNLLVTTVSPTDQAIDVVILGPNGYDNVIEVVSEQLVEGLEPGTYVLMATDDGLQMTSTKVEVALGRVAPVTLTLQPMEVLMEEGMTENYQAYGNFEVGDYGDYEAAAAEDIGGLTLAFDRTAFPDTDINGWIVGPDDYRQSFEGDTETLELTDLDPGAYHIAWTTEGADLAEGVTEVRAGEVATATLRLSALQ